MIKSSLVNYFVRNRTRLLSKQIKKNFKGTTKISGFKMYKYKTFFLD